MLLNIELIKNVTSSKSNTIPYVTVAKTNFCFTTINTINYISYVVFAILYSY